MCRDFCTQQANLIHVILKHQTTPCQCPPKHQLQAHIVPHVPSPHPHQPPRTAPLRLPISPLSTVHPSHLHLLSIPSSHPPNTFDPVPHCVYLKYLRPPLHPDRSLNPGCILLPRHFLFNRFLPPIGCPSQCPYLYKR